MEKILTQEEIEKREQSLYECALAVEKDSLLRQEMREWDMVSYEKYLELEDTFWGKHAKLAEKEKSLGRKKSKDFLESDE